jgi:RimJ/RimL family protein N-acetyltransferase
MNANLTIREITPFDAPWLFKITGDIEAVRYMGLQVHQTVHDAARLIEIYRTSPSNFVAIVDQASPGELLGVIAFEVQGHSAAIGIKLNRTDKRVRGAGRRVCKPFVDILLQQPGIWRVWSYCHVDNVPGRRVTERSGAVCEGVMRRYAVFPNLGPEPQDCRLYAIVRR